MKNRMQPISCFRDCTPH